MTLLKLFDIFLDRDSMPTGIIVFCCLTSLKRQRKAFLETWEAAMDKYFSASLINNNMGDDININYSA